MLKFCDVFDKNRNLVNLITTRGTHEAHQRYMTCILCFLLLNFGLNQGHTNTTITVSLNLPVMHTLY